MRRFLLLLFSILLSSLGLQAEDYPLYDPVPADGATDVDLGIYVKCSGWTYGDLFEVRWSKNADMSGYRSKRVSNNPSTDLNGLEEGTTYYWRIYAYDNSTWDFEPKSPIWHFTTIGGNTEEDKCELSDLPTDDPYYAATAFLCERGVLSGSKVDGKVNVYDKLKRAHLAKIAFRGLYTLNGGAVPESVPSDNYPTVYSDLATKTADNEYYRQAARALMYLDYDDGVTPFNRDRLNFDPDNTIARIHVLKVLMETFDIKPRLTDKDNPCLQEEACYELYQNDPMSYGYLRRAYDAGIIGLDDSFRPYDECLRGEAFDMLYHVIYSIESDNLFAAPKPSNAYFEPLNITTRTISQGVSLPMGNFQHYTKSSFTMGGTVPLAFVHTYNSYNTTLPEVFFGLKSSSGTGETYQPMTPGWSHNYQSFISVVGMGNDRRVIVHWGGGTIHVYKSDGTNLVAESVGVYDELKLQTEADGSLGAVVKTKSQMTYTFSNLGGSLAVLYLTGITDRNGNTLTVNYETGHNNAKRISNVSDGQRQLLFTYLDGTNLLSSVSDPLGRSILFGYKYISKNGLYQLTSFTDAEGNKTIYDYLNSTYPRSAYLLYQINMPKGNYIRNIYFTNSGRLYQSVSGSGDGSIMRTTINAYTNYYGITPSMSSEMSVYRDNTISTYSYSFNADNMATSLTGSKNLSITSTYDNAIHPQLPTSIQTNNSNVSDITYDDRGNVLSITVTGDGTLTTKYTYDTMNNLTSITDPKGNTTTYSYDAKGNMIKMSAPEGVTSSVKVNSKGHPVELTNAMGVVMQYEYNGYGNLVKTTLPALGLSTTSEYDAASRVISFTDALGRTTSYQYDNNDKLISTTNAARHTTQFAYDVNGNLSTITNAKGGVTTMAYDNVTDWLQSVEFAGAKRQYTYNSDGSVATMTKADGTQLKYSYDQLGRITDDGVNTYTYDDKLRLSSITHDGQTLKYTYDGFNRIVGTTLGSQTNTYTYDENSNCTSVNGITYTYDRLNRLTAVTFSDKTINYSYRKDSQVEQVVYPNGMTTTYDYDAVGRLIGKKTNLSNGTVVSQYDFTLDKVGNIIEQSTVEPYSNMTIPFANTSYTYNDGNRIIKAGDTSFAFDLNGNTTLRGSEPYQWSVDDRLIKFGNTDIAYDPLGHIASYGDITFTTDPMGMGNVLSDSKSGAQYVYGLGLEARIVNGKTGYYVTDVRGSVVAIVDDDGNITHRYQYDEYGNITQKEEADFNPFQYVGKHGVMALNDHLYYMRARHYDPTIGRFYSEDPIWSTNLYPYADNNPIMGIDPKGTDPISIAVLEYGTAELMKDGLMTTATELFQLEMGVLGGTLPTAIAPTTAGVAAETASALSASTTSLGILEGSVATASTAAELGALQAGTTAISTTSELAALQASVTSTAATVSSTTAGLGTLEAGVVTNGTAAELAALETGVTTTAGLGTASTIAAGGMIAGMVVLGGSIIYDGYEIATKGFGNDWISRGMGQMQQTLINEPLDYMFGN